MTIAGIARLSATLGRLDAPVAVLWGRNACIVFRGGNEGPSPGPAARLSRAPSTRSGKLVAILQTDLRQ